MEFRKITVKEQEQAIFIISQAFYYDCDGEYKLLDKGKFRYEDFYGAFDDDGKMCATLQREPHFMWLDGATVKSGGIANVASLPEYRRGGIVKNLLKLALSDMYNDGYVMSYLYPFSYPYYRKFGYELCNEMYRIEADPKDLALLQFEGSAKQFEPGEKGTDPGSIIEIYTEFSKKYNIMLDRDAWQWERKLEHDPVNSKTRTYIVYNKEGNACAYFTYVYDRQGHTSELSIKDLAWLDIDSMKLLMAFIGRFAGNVIKISFHIPPEMMPSYFWAEPRDYKIEYESSGMARVVNVEESLIILHKSESSGSFTIKVNDDFMKENNKSYKVSWKNGKTKVTEFDGTCDLECSIMAYTQIVTGFASLSQALARDDIKLRSNEELLLKTFPKKMVYVADFF